MALQDSLLSRFDLLFIVLDNPDPAIVSLSCAALDPRVLLLTCFCLVVVDCCARIARLRTACWRTTATSARPAMVPVCFHASQTLWLMLCVCARVIAALDTDDIEAKNEDAETPVFEKYDK